MSSQVLGASPWKTSESYECTGTGMIGRLPLRYDGGSRYGKSDAAAMSHPQK